MIDADALLVALAGFGFGLSLIVVVGPQNAFLLRVGVLGRGVAAVVTVCTLADVALIAAGTAGAGAVFRRAHWVLPVVRYAGAAFLLGYALLAARRALRPPPTTPDAVVPNAPGLRAVVLTALALTFLNPGVYLDTVVLLGSVANAHGGREWWFAAGAAVASAVWFAVIGFGARRLGRRFDRPSTWRALDAFVAVVMTITAVRLLLG
ncbi:LysE/ArgO family amino acid transporter [uncultured Jatrophihabitans sp.]|uniref:LysE/ArgO family amino acid transporter n=1 Tax=uncultured Jatrophihabitans sp. TaxID=1610747 RepID=UPI0035CA2227